MSADTRIGAEIAGYRVESMLARGGMGVVYLAEHLRLGRKVAFKVLAPELAEDERFRDRFISESRIAASIDHPNIVPIYDADEYDGMLFIAMRYVEGTDLRKLLKVEKTLDPARTLKLVEQIAAALDVAHERGLVHRDVKPANVLLDRSEHVYLSDFGLTKRALSVSGLTETGQLVGTIDYVAPEHIRGDAADGRADVYSLGCVVHECLTGDVPFARPLEVAVLWAHVNEPPSKVSEIGADIPPEVDGVVGRALAKKPEDRYGTAHEMVADLKDAFGANERVGALAPWRRRRRARRLRAAIAVVAVLALVAIGLPILLRGGSGTTLARVSANSVGVIDPESGVITGQVGVGEFPDHVAAGQGAVWVANEVAETVSQIDPKTNAVIDTIPVGRGLAGIAVGFGFVWVAESFDGTVAKISPETKQVVDRIQVGPGPDRVAAGEGAVWVTDPIQGTLVSIDPTNDEPSDPIPLGQGPTGVAVGQGAVWVTLFSENRVARVDPATHRATHFINVGNGPNDLAAGPSGVWVANFLDDTVSRIDNESLAVTDTGQVDEGPSAIVVAPDAVWVSSEYGETVQQVDPATGEVARRISLGNRAGGIAVTPDDIFVTARESGRGHRGGSVRAWEPFNTGIDPAETPATTPYTHDTLVDLKRTGGVESTLLVPDLAMALPAPADGGTTYTFQLRPGIRFSDGEPLTPDDVRASIERLFEVPYPFWGPRMLTGIVGAKACIRPDAEHDEPGRCDLSSGIETLAQAGTVTFHLTRPDVTFPRKLTIAAIMPAGTPSETLTRAPIPGTGPYMIESFEVDNEGLAQSARLVRNPYFQEWSKAATPDGFPDVIDWRFNLTSDVTTEAVEATAADFTLVLGQDLIEDLSARHPELLHEIPQQGTFWLLPDWHEGSPFHDVRARRALSLAIDRSQLASLYGWGTASPTCQNTPPTLPSFEPYCPNMAGPEAPGTWTSPDLERARKLVKASGTQGSRVVVASVLDNCCFTEHSGWHFQLARYVVSVLGDLGYRATFDRRADPGAGDVVDVMAVGWRLIGWPTLGSNTTYLLCDVFAAPCDATLTHRIAEAIEVEERNPADANPLWAEIDRELTDQAWLIPMFTTNGWLMVSARVHSFHAGTNGVIYKDQFWVE